jgi:hypothetical protein
MSAQINKRKIQYAPKYTVLKLAHLEHISVLHVLAHTVERNLYYVSIMKSVKQYNLVGCSVGVTMGVV